MEKNVKKDPIEMVYGVHPLVELLKAKRRKLVMLYTTKPEPKAWSLIAPLLPAHGLTLRFVTREALTKLAASSDHQGFVALVTPFPFRKKLFEPSKQPFLLMLDGIQDARNLGAILRTAYATGTDGVLITQKKSVDLKAAALKASTGLAEYLEIMMVPSAKAAVQELKKTGYHIYLATVDQSISAAQVAYQEPLCLVIGGEGFGISPEVQGMGTHISLPQRCADISYNASVAAGILLFLIAVQGKKI
jgi:23S rRNA (guanosine2251-2'-O)-methyltransferase